MSLSPADEIYLRRKLADFGTPVSESGLQYKQDPFTGNGVTTVFTLTQTPSTAFIPFVYVNTILQITGYSFTNAALTFVAAPTGSILVTYSY